MLLPQHDLPAAGKPKLLDRAREILRANYYSRRTEDVYLGWMRRFILFVPLVPKLGLGTSG
jgi:hypothetical protein